MFERARCTSGTQRIGWAFLTSVASGATIWCTHFVAMLAFRAGVPVTLDPVLTITSLVIAIVGTFAGIGLAAGNKACFRRGGRRDLRPGHFRNALHGNGGLSCRRHRYLGLRLCHSIVDLFGRFRERRFHRPPGPDRAPSDRPGHRPDRVRYCDASLRCHDRNEHTAPRIGRDAARCRRASGARASHGRRRSNGHCRRRLCRLDRSTNTVRGDARADLHGAQRPPHRIAEPIRFPS